MEDVNNNKYFAGRRKYIISNAYNFVKINLAQPERLKQHIIIN